MTCDTCKDIKKVNGRNHFWNCGEFPLKLRLEKDLKLSHCGKYKKGKP